MQKKDLKTGATLGTRGTGGQTSLALPSWAVSSSAQQVPAHPEERSSQGRWVIEEAIIINSYKFTEN